MTQPTPVTFVETDIERLAGHEGRIAIIIGEEGKLDVSGRRVNRLSKGALKRAVEARVKDGLKTGDVFSLAYPTGMAAVAVDVACLPRSGSQADARKVGAAFGRNRGKENLLLAAGNARRVGHVVSGAVLRDYTFRDHKTGGDAPTGAIEVMSNDPADAKDVCASHLALAEGCFFTRDLVNEPANILTTTEFADRLAEMESLGLKIEVLEEDKLEELGMRTLLAVGQGSDSPSKVVIMQWNGGPKGQAPLALVGKGVVFDTGGISLKPAAGMEDMTMDMGGAGTVAGVMRALALRKAKANVVGLVGLVENMPSGTAIRPGDVVKTMKGDTVEILNTDAEGRLVLCDVMWYTQERFEPAGMIDLATLTGAIIIGLGHENAGVFSNDDALCNAFLKAAKAEDEGAWRMPLGKAYDDMLKSPIADMKNIGGRPAGSITAAQYLQRFVKDGVPWIHLDIAGVASLKSDTTLAPKGATGVGRTCAGSSCRRQFRGGVSALGAAMFYHLTRHPLEVTLRMLLNKATQAGWRVAVRGPDVPDLERLDAQLWQGTPESFLAHGLAGGAYDAEQPILLGTQTTPAANGAECLMTIGGADLRADEVTELTRVCVLFDGNDPQAVQVARGQWKMLKDAAVSAQYWSEESGQWEKKAEM